MKIPIKIMLNTLILLMVGHLISVQFDSIYIAMLVAVLWGVLSVSVKPLLNLFTLPVRLLTLGLSSLLISAMLFMMMANFIPGFHIDSFVDAFILATIVSLSNSIINTIL